VLSECISCFICFDLVVMSVIFKYFYLTPFYCTLYYCTIVAFDNDAIKEATYLLTYRVYLIFWSTSAYLDRYATFFHWFVYTQLTNDWQINHIEAY